MSEPTGFSYKTRSDGTVVILHRGRAAATLRGARAAKFLTEVEDADDQLTMARWTGAYKIGNERMGKNHPRNQRR
ncbi:hypothetical protein [Glycomyces sp. NRRL B-16210]|uniref:hypothetical protein n=1 Tax=Glycomyces sp. NRRL B-16210 TaxID=1463821 RepID=UPI0004C0FD22|nr:hypothetical protein [Glycomyces sp. NRRL B-16210]